MDSSLKSNWIQTLDLINKSGHFDSGTMTWIKKTSLFKIENQVAYISCQNIVAINLIRENLQLFEATLSEMVGSNVSIELITEKEMAQMMPDESLKQKAIQLISRGFDPGLTFDSFVRGPSNQEALAACQMACLPKNKGMFNPLMLYGNSGLGKTHILNALGNALAQTQSNAKVIYIYAGDLVSLLLDAMRTKSKEGNAVEKIKETLLDCDYFLVDDIQNLRSDSCQEVFFTLYNELIRQKKQIILTSDTHPSEISSLTKRLISRFSSGLIVNISKPGAEHAKRILMKKIEGHEDVIDIDDDVLDFLARGYSDDVRALEGALNRLIFNATLFNPPTISMSFALGVLKDEPIISEPEQLNAKSIKKAVIRYYGLSYADLEGKSRQKKISQARQICIYLMRDMLQLPYAEIGSQLGNRDHTTISSSFSRAKKMIQKESTWKDAVDEIKRKIT